jgi:glycosyltransferase involved in cell wall biosynthesis
MRVLLLTLEAFGGNGGIAQYNRDLISALASIPEVGEVVVIPRFAADTPGELPPKIVYRLEGAGGKAKYAGAVLKAMYGRFDRVICGHINLLPLAWMASMKSRAPLAVVVYGIDVWKQHRSPLVRMLLGRVNAVWSISEITRDRMAAWSGKAHGKFHILPNAIALDHFEMTSEKNGALLARYGLRGRKVMLLLARLSSAERYKGVDELIELMPDLCAREPDTVFLVAGEGDDRMRLEAKARALGVSDRVVFTGYIPESEKAAHYNLADAFVMPGRGEGFGNVYLEAMACGVPVVASELDGSREATRFGMLGQVVNPDDKAALMAAIIRALHSPKKIPEGLDYFSISSFQHRLRALVAPPRDD